MMFGCGGNRIGGTQAGYGQRRTTAQTLTEHDLALKELTKGLKESPSLHMPNIQPRKASFAPTPSFEECSPTQIKDLEVGEVHRCRMLRGRLITKAIKMQSVQSVLDDEAGGVVTVSTGLVSCSTDVCTCRHFSLA